MNFITEVGHKIWFMMAWGFMGLALLFEFAPVGNSQFVIAQTLTQFNPMERCVFLVLCGPFVCAFYAVECFVILPLSIM